VGRTKLLALVVFLTAAAQAFEVDLAAPASVPSGEDWELHAFVINNSVNVSNPDCTVNIYKDGGYFSSEGMASGPEYAYSTHQFDGVDDYSAEVYCQLDGGYQSDELYFEVTPNAHLSLDTSGGDSVGDTLVVKAYYRDLEDDAIQSATCMARLYADGDLQESSVIYYSTSYGAYYGTFMVQESGDHSVRVTCSAAGYSEVTRTEYFEVEKLPVTVSPSTIQVSGSYGQTKTIAISFSPTIATCTSNYGSMSRYTGSQYKLSLTLDFIGERDVIVTCSAPSYISMSRTIKFKSEEVATRLSVGFSTEHPYSFQQFSISPNYYDTDWNAIREADCQVDFGNQTYDVKSFERVTLKAPAGPADESLTVSCDKAGYKRYSGVVTFEVRPIEVTGELQYPQSAKEEERIPVRVRLVPAINAQCSLTGELSSISDGTLGHFNESLEFTGTGEFALMANESGELTFDVECSAAGYTNFAESGSLSITMLSQREEIQASIILTTLTIILAIGFVLVRRWM
jgi:hypothetical protein